MPENTYSPIVINEEKQTPISGIHHLTTEEYYDLTHHTHDASELTTVNDEDETVSIKELTSPSSSGTASPFSHLLTVWRAMCSLSASSSCEYPFCFLSKLSFSPKIIFTSLTIR